MRFRILLRLMMIPAFVVASGLGSWSPAAGQAWSPPTKVWLSATGHTVDGLFLSTWRAHSALLGNPISEELTTGVTLGSANKQPLTIQYFENAALAYTPDDKRGPDWQVQGLELGVAALRAGSLNPQLQSLDSTGSCGVLKPDECRLFSTTKHSVKWGFLAYWNANRGDQLIGNPITEEFVAGDGWTVQYFERAVLEWKKSTGVASRAVGKASALSLKIRTDKIAQPDGVPVYAESLFVRPAPSLGVGGVNLGFGPGPQQGGSKEIVVSLTREAMWVYQDGRLILSTLVSTGVAHSAASTTPVGSFSILTKYDLQTMSGVIDDQAYNVPDVPWVMYFDDFGDALHGTYWHNNFGTPMSHGCVNQPMDVAKFMYGWAPIGTPVTILA